MEPRIYIGCLASRNNGDYVGQWLTLSDYDDVDDLMAAITKEVLMKSTNPNVTVENEDGQMVPASEEWGIFDTEYIEAGEYDDLGDVLRRGQLISEYGEEWQAFEYLRGPGTTEEQFQDARLGQYESHEDYCMERAIECGMVDEADPSFSWIDWEHAWTSYFRFDVSEHNGWYFND